MPERIEALSWDSEFFGIPIGRVDLDGTDAADLDEIGTEARDRAFDCVYGQLDAGNDPSSRSVDVQAFGFQLIEVNMVMVNPGDHVPGLPEETRWRYATEDDLDKLHDSLDVLAPWSRFGVDPRFGQEAARRMHGAWVERAIREDHRMAAIVEDEDGIAGVSTHVDSGQTGVPGVDLMGVLKRGKQVSSALLQALVDWAPPGPIEAGPCAARNISPLRFLEFHGFAVGKVTYTYHLWREGAGQDHA